MQGEVLRPMAVVIFACIRSGSGPHTLSMLCFKPCKENESEPALDTLLVSAGMPAGFGTAQSHVLTALSGHRARRSPVLLLPHPPPPSPPVFGCLWWKCHPSPLGHCRHLAQELFLPVYLLLKGWASKAWDLEMDVVGRMQARMPFAPSSPTGSQPCLSSTEVYIQCLGKGHVRDTISLCLSSAWNTDVPKFS